MKELRFSLRLLWRSPLALAGLIMVLFYLALAVAWPYLPLKSFKFNPVDANLAPSAAHPLGTTPLGQDILAGVILAAQVDATIAIVVVGVSLAIGVILGVVSGYLGGLIDEALMRVTDVFLSIPALILAIAIAAALGRSIEHVMIAIIITNWPSYTRLVRGQALSLRENQYVEAAKAVGARESRIIFRHILPNTLSPITVQATLDIGSVVLVAAALSFIGIGAGPETPEWGAMIARGFEFLAVSGFWWEVVFPGLFILFFVMSFNLFGDGLRDILDPRLRR
jgi:peptide/nickel transport system permease protein